MSAARSRLVAAISLPLKLAAGRVAHRMKRARFDHAQQLHLDGGVQIAQLVEKDRAERGTGFRASPCGRRSRR